MIPAPNDLVAIPPVIRTAIYYALALALVVVGALVQAGRLDPLYLVITSGVAGVFFGVAGSNVASKGPKVEPVVELEPLPSEAAMRGYGSGI